MQWFKNAYDRAAIAESVLQSGLVTGQAEEYAPGFRRTTFGDQAIGTLVVMHHYPRRNRYNATYGYDEPVSDEFYRAQLKYRSARQKIVHSLVEFDAVTAYVKRSTEYAVQLEEQIDPSHIWDEAMSALDASLYLQAGKLGQSLLPQLVQRVF